MDRRNFLRVLPMTAVAPISGKEVKDGVLALELPKGPGHFVVVIDESRVDIDSLMQPGILPEGSTGGWIIPVRGNGGDVADAIKFYKLDESSDQRT